MRKEDEKKVRIQLDRFGSAMIDKLRQEESLVKIPKQRKVFKGKLKESAVLVLSDMHLGLENYFIDLETGESILTYDVEIAIKEANRLLDGISGINQLLSRSYNIETLYIFALGDLVEGDIIIQNQQFFIEAGVGNQMLLAVKLITNLIQELLKTFKQIKLINIAGNHGRMTRRANIPQPFYNNFDFLTGKMLQEVFRQEKRVNIQTPEAWFFRTKIYNWQYFLHHGASIRSWMGIPYYGIVRQSRQRRAEIEFDVEVMGHFHQQMEIPLSSKAITLVNGSWIEKGMLGWRKYGHLTKAEQLYFGVSKKRPRSWQFALTLVPKENQK